MKQDDRPFSRRFGYRGPEQEITIREDAPEMLRQAIVSIADCLGLISVKNASRCMQCPKEIAGQGRNWKRVPECF